MKNTLVLSIAGATLLLSAPYMPKVIVYNTSPSIPLGFYYLSKSTVPKIGDNIAISIDEKSSHLLLKPVAATQDDFVCINSGIVSINNQNRAAVLTENSTGEILPVPKLCRKLNRDEFFAISSHSRSYDSRYFGVVKRAQVCGVIFPLYTWGSNDA